MGLFDRIKSFVQFLNPFQTKKAKLPPKKKPKPKPKPKPTTSRPPTTPRPKPPTREPDAPVKIVEPDSWDVEPRDYDIFDLMDWHEEGAPTWLHDATLSLEMKKVIDDVGLPPSSDWDNLKVVYGPETDNHWTVEIEAGGDTYTLDFGDEWLWPWELYDWAEDEDIDVDSEVEYSDAN